MGDLTKNFSLKEFRCHDGTGVPVKYQSNVRKLAENLQVLRDEVGVSIRINSGYRTVSYNKKIGGAGKSQHLYAKAADITVSKMTPTDVRKKILELIKNKKMKQGGIGLYPTFVHYDIRGYAARWSKTSSKATKK